MTEPVRTALVTGGNRGIGLATAHAFGALGYRVIVATRERRTGDRAAGELRAKGVVAHAVEIDLARSETIRQALHEIDHAGIHPDVLVNNAGVYPEGGAFDIDEAILRTAMDVHFFGPFVLTTALLGRMKKRRYGRIVNVSSSYGSFAEGLAGPAAYALSKCALNALTVKLADEVSGDVLVNAVCPGWVRTRMGGTGATRSVDEAAEGIVWAATLPAKGPNGGFFRDRRPIPW
ncbi:MAG: SDR family NAD(P)-dependent oxidoreductase [Polyangiaceae bacterium]